MYLRLATIVTVALLAGCNYYADEPEKCPLWVEIVNAEPGYVEVEVSNPAALVWVEVDGLAEGPSSPPYGHDQRLVTFDGEPEEVIVRAEHEGCRAGMVVRFDPR